MRNLIASLLRYRPLMVVALAAWLAGGFYMFLRLDIEAYPDPSPPLVEVITQNPSWSAEEIERQVTLPIETVLFGIPRLEEVRSISIFGLSDVKLYFSYDSDYYWDRQEVLNRLQLVQLPVSLSPQLSPWSPIGEIYRYRLYGPNFSLNELKATENWFVTREIKQVSGIIDVTSFGGSTRQYVAEIDPRKLLQYNVTLPQVVAAVGSSNTNAGGSYLTMGAQSVNVRGLGLLRSIPEMRNVVITERNGVPVFLRDIADVHEGFQPRLGQVGVNHDDDAVEGIVLLQRGEQSLPALGQLEQRVKELNNGLLPRGMKLLTLYDRTDLIHLTTATVRHVVVLGLILVTAILIVFLGDIPISLIAALTIPCSLLFAFSLMVLSGRSANLISIGAIDFGILVDASVIVLENIYRRFQAASSDASTFDLIADASAEAVKPVLFSVLVIIVALVPLFTMQGVPGKIFSPMSETYGFALTGALLFAILLAPVLVSWMRPEKVRSHHTRLVIWLGKRYVVALKWTCAHRKTTLAIAGGALVATLAVGTLLGGEFMPKLEEGNLWVRATLPQDVSYESGTEIAHGIRETLLTFPVVAQVVSQAGRPDDGTDVTTFNNIEFMVSLKNPDAWPSGLTKEELIRRMGAELDKFPGVDFNFSQNIQDNVEEAMSGVKGENSLKLFGDDIDVLVEKAGEIRDVMAGVPGVADLAVFQETGQPELLVSIDRAASARYGLMAADVNAAVQAAIGGLAATQILEGDRRFDFVIRYQPAFRRTPEAIRNILLPTPDGNRVPIGQVADVALHEGAFMIYRENGRRYIPVKFSVRGRDLAGTIEDIQVRLSRGVHLPEGYHLEWAGEYDSLRKEQRRLLVIVPISLLIVFGLLFTAFNSLRHALLVLTILPFAEIGGVFSLLLTRTPFSISAAVGFASVIGVCTLGGVVLVSGIRRKEKDSQSMLGAIERGCLGEMRPVLMACAAAGLGLLPAAVSTGIGVQAQQPLARVVVGGMVTSPLAILFLIPVLATYWLPSDGMAVAEERKP
ncbi:MAG TPA: CusA/CzcA family heavy metal efflux RND transporter [Verrucomicrobiae bacterium]|jgi:cobalt-zinc-cadmium resistance protein CzcA|nr:CusA/CzcA family heavy metal efflux RND transporter [Verrucomicrobiae bacterium]